jgi:hypothetical protein
MQMSKFSWRWLSRQKPKPSNAGSLNAAQGTERFAGSDRRQLLQALSVDRRWRRFGRAAAKLAMAKDASELPSPKRVVTGRDEAGKSVFKSFDVTSKVVEIDATIPA